MDARAVSFPVARPGASADADPAYGDAAAPAGLGHYRLMSDMLDTLHLGFCLFDADDRALVWNRTFLRIFPEHAGHVAVGEPYAANLRRFYEARLPPAERDSIDRHIAEGIARHRTQTHPFIFEHRGQWVRVASQPVPGLGRLRIWTPIGPPGGADAGPAARETGLLQKVMPFDAEDGDGLSLLDATGRIVWANDRFARCFGLVDPDAAVGRTHAQVYAALLGTAAGPDFGPWLQTLADAERFTGAPFELPLPAGGWLRVLQQRMQDNTVVSSFADISAMKALQRELTRAREAAEKANAAKDAFLATVSHELRTPLGGILGMLDTLDDGRLPADQAGRVGVARNLAEALVGLLDDLLTFSRLDAGHVTIEAAPASPAGLLEAVVRLMQPRVADKALALGWEIAADVPPLVLCDAARLRQVLLNLVGNALKFTERGGIRIAARRGAALPDGRFLLEVAVTDTGIGIPDAALGTIFDPFVQVESGTGRRFGGTGLGLAICRELVGAMGGGISVTSTRGAGAASASPSPAARRRRRPPPPPPPPWPRPLAPARRAGRENRRRCRRCGSWWSTTIRSTRRYAMLYLQRLGMRVTTVGSGAEALAACAEAFDLIMLDLQMPEMDGFATLAALRASDLPGAGLPVIALTAHAGEESRLRCLAAGMQGFVTKPIRLGALAAAIATAIGPAAPRVPPPAPAATPVLDTEQSDVLMRQSTRAGWAALVDDFEDHARRALARLVRAAERGAPHGEVAHELKGVAWNIGAERLGNLLQALEGLGPVELRLQLPELQHVLEATIAALRRLRTGS